MTENKTFINKYASISVIIMSVLFPYYFPGTDIPLDTVLILINGILFGSLYIFRKNNAFRWPKAYKYFFIYSLIIPIVGLITFGNFNTALSSYKSIVPFTLCLIYSIPFIDYKLICKYYRLLIIIVCAIFLCQEIMYVVVGYRFSALIPFLPVRYADISTSSFMTAQMYAYRSSSVFLEPAHFAQFVLGYLAIILGNNLNRNKFFSRDAILVSLVLLITMSGNAVLLMALLWCIFFFRSKISRVKKYIIILPLSVLAVLLSVRYLSSTEQGEHLLSRTQELNSEQRRMSSGMIRIFRGYFVYSDMPVSQQIIGVGAGYTPNVIDKSSFVWMFYDFERYLNNAQILLIGYGIIGTLIFILFILKLMKCRNKVALMTSVLFIGLCLIEYFWCTGKMILYLSIPLVIYSQEHVKTYN